MIEKFDLKKKKGRYFGYIECKKKKKTLIIRSNFQLIYLFTFKNKILQNENLRMKMDRSEFHLRIVDHCCKKLSIDLAF